MLIRSRSDLLTLNSLRLNFFDPERTMKPTKLPDPHTPWLPLSWVGDPKPVKTEILSDDSRRKYAAVKVNKLLARICSHED